MANIDIGGRLHSTATGNVVAGANEILDDNEQKKQSQINAELIEAVENLSEEMETKQGTITGVVTPEIEEDGGDPAVESSFENNQINFAFKNLKGETGAQGATGPQGPQGDSAIWTGEGEPWSGIKNTTGRSTTEPMSQKAVTDELNSIGHDIYDYEDDGETDTNLTSRIEVTDVGKMVNAPGGSLSNSSGQDASGYIDIEDYEAITYPQNSATSANPAWGIAFYDANKESKDQTGWYEKAIYDASARDYVAKRIDVPEGAKYVRLSLRKTGFSTPTLTGHKKNYIKASKLEGVKAQVDEVATNVEVIDHEVYKYEVSGREEVADLSNQITHHNSGYNVIWNGGGLAGGSSQNDATDYIDIGNYDAIKYSRNSGSANPMTWGIAFYAEDKSFKGGQAAIVNSSAADYELTEITVPEGAKYVRMTIRKTTSTFGSPVLKGLKNVYTKTPKIPDLEERIEAIEESIPSIGVGIFPPLIGVPEPYLVTPTEQQGVTVFEHVADLHNAYDALCTQYQKWMHKEENIGTDATNTYEVRHYTLRYQTPLVSAYRDGSGTNYWSDEDMPMRRILLMTGIHAMEQYSTLGTYMAVKAICESNEPWAKFIKANAIIDIIPIINPWGLENNSSNNSNGVNLNRDYNSETPQVETQNVINLIQSLMGLNLGGIVDMHNTADGDTYIVSNAAYKEYIYYARLAQQLNVIMNEPLASVYGSTGRHMHCWITTETGQGHWYADQCGLLGITCETEVTASAHVRSSMISAMQAVNSIISFLQKIK